MHMKNKNDLNLINTTLMQDAWPYQASFYQELIDSQDILHEVSIVLVDPVEIKMINERYRQKNSVTDVLSFPFEDHDGGDIILCPKVIASYAYARKIPYPIRFLHLIIHSMAHLQGYDHDEESAAQSMFEHELQLWIWAQKNLSLKWDLKPDNTYTYNAKR